MTPTTQGTEEAERCFDAACAAEAAGRKEDAIALLRRAAILGHQVAQSNLGVDLTNLGEAPRSEGLRWLRKSARMGNGMAAWNLAMEHRLSGSRRAYLYWMRQAAHLGEGEAVQIIEEIERRRAGRELWFMLRAVFVDAADVEWTLENVRDGTTSAADAAGWAEGIVGRRDALGVAPEERARLLPVLWEIARSELTPQRATELLVKLAR